MKKREGNGSGPPAPEIDLSHLNSARLRRQPPPIEDEEMTDLQRAVDEILAWFEIPDEQVHRIVDAFVEQASSALESPQPQGIPMLPSFVTSVPNGTEKGLCLACDLGGSNFRVCAVRLLGNSKHEITQKKWAVSQALMQSTADTFFAFLAEKVDSFLRAHISKDLDELAHDETLPMGFTFSFPVHQESLHSGTLVRWTKGYTVKGVVGKNVCALFQDQLDKRQLKVKVKALLNDTVGTLAARSYASGPSETTLLSFVVGTGTNAAYVERLARVKKCVLSQGVDEADDDRIMIINTEWGSFDNNLAVLKQNKYDEAVNAATWNPGIHMFEKQVSGMFLGELFRRVILDLQQRGLMLQTSCERQTEMLTTPWSTDTSVLSVLKGDTSEELLLVEAEFFDRFGYRTDFAERRAIKTVADAIGARSATLVATAIAGVLKLTDGLQRFEVVNFGANGSVMEFYPGYEAAIRAGLRRTFIGADEKRIVFSIEKDGGGVGAAVCAIMED